MRLILAPEAQDDLAAIGEWIARDNPGRAFTFLEELQAHIQILRQAPEGFPLLARYEKLGIGRHAWRGYLTFYRIEDSRVTILRILHGAQDYERLLFGGES